MEERKKNISRDTDSSQPEQNPNKNLFAIHKHDASHSHYDFRLEIGGVLVSWTVPKEPSEKPGEKRLAVRTEDHNLDNVDFEGKIPEGKYGTGTVEIWDIGKYENTRSISMTEALENGKLVFNLHGNKLKGGYTLLRIKKNNSGSDREQWLLFKKKE